MGRPDEAVIISSCLTNDEGVVIARCTNWPQPYKYLDMPKADITIRVDGDKIYVRTNDVPVKGLALYVEDVDSVDFEDNLLDLVPGDEQVVVANGLNDGSVTYRYYGKDF
jgi:beta-mannosidase